MTVPFVDLSVLTAQDLHASLVLKRARVATTVAGTLASSFENGDTVDGVVLVTGDRILVKNQAAGAENGIYTVNASGTPTRALDFDSSSEVLPNMMVVVSEGTTNADTVWQLTNNAAITLGSTALVFAQFGAGAAATFNTGTANVVTDETTSSATPGALATAQATTVTTGTKARIDFWAEAYCATVPSDAQITFVVSGATTRAAQTVERAYVTTVSANKNIMLGRSLIITGLTAGSNTFTLQFASPNAVAVHFVGRTFSVQDLGS